MHCCLLKQLRAASMCRSFCLGFAQLCFPGLLLLLSLATLTHGQGGSSPELVPPLPGETPGATAAGSLPPGAAGPPLELPSDATALPEQGGQPPAPAALPPTPSGGIQLSPAPPSGFGLAPGIGAPAGKLAWLQVPLRLPPLSIAQLPPRHPRPPCRRAAPDVPGRCHCGLRPAANLALPSSRPRLWPGLCVAHLPGNPGCACSPAVCSLTLARDC